VSILDSHSRNNPFSSMLLRSALRGSQCREFRERALFQVAFDFSNLGRRRSGFGTHAHKCLGHRQPTHQICMKNFSIVRAYLSTFSINLGDFINQLPESTRERARSTLSVLILFGLVVLLVRGNAVGLAVAAACVASIEVAIRRTIHWLVPILLFCAVLAFLEWIDHRTVSALRSRRS